MISKAFKTTILKGLLGQGSNYSGYITLAAKCYIGLSYTKEVIEDSSGNITFEEPSTSYGYKRYLIGDCNSSASYRMTVSDGSAYNSDTLYFDEATADWTNDSDKIRWFGLFTSESGGTPFAWGKIVDETTREAIEIEVKAGQLPIIRVNQLKLTLTDTND